jgi:chromatin remodeling complex protein RSC6
VELVKDRESANIVFTVDVMILGSGDELNMLFSKRRFTMLENEDVLRENTEEDNKKDSSDSEREEKKRSTSPWPKEDKKKNRRPGWFSS